MSPDKVSIRAANAAELHVAAALRDEMALEMGHCWDDEHPGWRERFAAFFAERIRRGDACVYYAEVGGTVVGMALFSVLDEYRAATTGQPRGWVNSVYVRPHLRRRGIAKRLMEAGIAWMRSRGCAVARLRTSDAGRPLYEQLGFVTGTEMELSL